MSDQAKKAFALELKKEDDQVDLIHASLLLAEYLVQPTGIDMYRNIVHKMAENIRPQIASAETDDERIQILNHYLFEELKFTGNTENYYHPDNSYLHRVLDMRRGIPISLSVIYLEIGWSLGLPVFGVNTPGHFIVGYEAVDYPIFIDVFNQGRLLSEEDCLIELAQLPLSEIEPFRQEHLKPAPKKLILHRMLLNLKQIYVTLKEWQVAYKTIDLMLQIQPNLANEIRDRGLIAYRLDRLKDAIFDIRRYLLLAPNAKDAAWLQQHLHLMERKLAQMN